LRRRLAALSCRRYFCDRDAEAVAATISVLDVLAGACTATECLAELGDRDTERTLGDRAAFPDLIDQLFFADQRTGLTHQTIQQVELLRIDLDQHAVSAQLPSHTIKDIVTEGQRHVSAPPRALLIASQ
jgi:hypothetical protein